MRKLFKNEIGITLIALIITVIILLILAGISLNLVIGKNGIIKNAKQAKFEMEKKDEEEALRIILAKYIGKELQINQSLKEYLKDKVREVEDNEDGTLTVLLGKYEFDISEDSYEIIEPTISKVTDESPGELEGEGTENNPYIVSSIEDLVAFSNSVNGIKINENGEFETTSAINYAQKYVILKQTLDFKSPKSYVDSTRKDFGDINGNGVIEELKTELTTEAGFMPIGGTNTFNGTFDGKENEIRRIYIRREKNVGLFGKISMANIKNIGVTGEIIATQCYVAVIAGQGSGTITNCYNKANITGCELGGIAGRAYGMKIEKCCNEGNLNGTAYTNTYGVGGIVGRGVGNVSVISSYNKGKIYSDTHGSGGIFGRPEGITEIINCYNMGDMSGKNASGGIVGFSVKNVSILNCYNSATIYSDKFQQFAGSGGIIGQTSGTTTINNCINFGEIKSIKEKGTIIGYIKGEQNITINNTYYLTNSSQAIGYGTATGEAKQYSEEYMKSEQFVEELNDNISKTTDSEQWLKWMYNKNQFPTFIDKK